MLKADPGSRRLENIIDIEASEDDLGLLLRSSMRLMQDEGINVAGAAQIYDANNVHFGRIVLLRATDKPRALQVLIKAHISAR